LHIIKHCVVVFGVTLKFAVMKASVCERSTAALIGISNDCHKVATVRWRQSCFAVVEWF